MQTHPAGARSALFFGPWVVPLTVAGGCLVLSALLPGNSPVLLAMVLGCVVANTRVVSVTARSAQIRAARTLLRLGVVLVGFKLSAQALASLGPSAVLVALSTVGVTYAVTAVVGDRLDLDRGLVTLVAAGFSVCGAAAIAAVESKVERNDRDVGLAVAMVTVFGTIMIVAVPALASWTGLTHRQAAVWAGASIHEVAQVVAAASSLGVSALAVATTVKLARVASLPAIYLVAAGRGRSGRAVGAGLPVLPWFVAGFLLTAALRSSGLAPAAALGPTNTAATLLLAGGMYGLGLGLRIRDLFPVPLRLVLLCTVSTATAAILSWAMAVALV